MTLSIDQAVTWLDEQLASKTGKKLTKLERVLVNGAWYDQTYLELAQETGATPQYMRKVGYDLWRKITLAFNVGREIGKKNLRTILEAEWKLPPNKETTSFSEHSYQFQATVYGDRIPEVPQLLERETELSQLLEASDRNRVILITGVPGVGKTSLAATLIHNCQIKDHFEVLIWKSLEYTPTLKEVLNELNQVLEDNIQDEKGYESLEQHFFSRIRARRTLIVFDSAEAVQPSHSPIRTQWQEYEKFLSRFGQENHQSCLVMTSHSEIDELLKMKAHRLPIHFLRLQGLSMTAGMTLFRQKGITGEQRWPKLLATYKGNPLLINTAADRILQQFAGDANKSADCNTYLATDYVNNVCENLLFGNGIDQQINQLVIKILLRSSDELTIQQVIKILLKNHIHSSYTELMLILSRFESYNLVESNMDSALRQLTYRISDLFKKSLLEGQLARRLNLLQETAV